MDNYMLHYMLMERQRSSEGKETPVLRNTPKLRRERTSRGQSSPASSSPLSRESPAVKSAAATAISSEAIRRRAYEIYVERGGVDGHDVEDWIQAERELLASEEAR